MQTPDHSLSSSRRYGLQRVVQQSGARLTVDHYQRPYVWSRQSTATADDLTLFHKDQKEQADYMGHAAAAPR